MREHEASPVHLPSPTAYPVTLALGLTLVGAGLLLNPAFAIAGALLMIGAIAGWVADLRAEASHYEQPHHEQSHHEQEDAHR